jgi:phosphatidylserine/phosphatidylglycerophosphate/cardiolipin synthase-like enzyme
MSNSFSQLSDNAMKAIASGLRSGRITLPGSTLQIGRIVAGDLGAAVSERLSELSTLQFNPEQVATLLDSILADREAYRTTHSNSIDLVTSGPEAPGVTNRDTSVVVREMFAHAQYAVTVVGYAVYQGQKVFEALAQRMELCPELDVQLFLNISRPDRDTTRSEILVSRFVERFKSKQWPNGARLPSVYYDPRSVADKVPIRSSLHAKCIVVDQQHVFVSSANFTEAGQQRNIEVGLRLDEPGIAKKLVEHFKKMVDTNQFLKAM